MTVILGFIAGAIAAVTVQEVLSLLFLNFWVGWDGDLWGSVANASFPDFPLPRLLLDALIGGLWGAIIAMILGSRPMGPLTFKGLLLGLLLPALIGMMVLVPLLTGRFAPFFGGDPSKIIPVLFILGGFGAVTGWLYGLFRYGHLPGFGDEEMM